MNVIWWIDSIWLWFYEHWIICWNEKKRKREFGQKEKTMKRIRHCVIGVFDLPWMHPCETWKTGECVDEKVVMVKEWKARRKEWKKKRWEKGKGKKWFWEKSFLFLLTVSLPLPFFPSALTTPQHTHSLIHLTPYNVTHWCTPSLANRAVCCCHWEHMAPSNRAVMTSFSFLQLEDFYYSQFHFNMPILRNNVPFLKFLRFGLQ